MSNVLFYSKYCDYCKKLLYEIGKSKVQKNIHFCICLVLDEFLSCFDTICNHCGFL